VAAARGIESLSIEKKALAASSSSSAKLSFSLTVAI
jgi:hypothetical protein